MKVLIACEASQEVCKAFRAKGHEAYSCDIEDCYGGRSEWHIKGDAIEQTYSGKYDIMIAHPPCTFLTNAGVRWLNIVDGKPTNQERFQKLLWARRFFMDLVSAPIKIKAIENPIPHKYAALPKYSQIIQPWMFGHTESKATCLWLYGLPNLVQTNNVYEEMMKLPYKDRNKVHYASPGPERARIRSKTYPGIAAAMAEQWG